MNRVVGGIFFFVFLLVGCAFTYFGAVRPFFQSWSARDWMKMPCHILSSEVSSSSDSDGTTYGVKIRYAYRVEDRDYTSGSYQFLNTSSSGRADKARVVAQYQKGQDYDCFVNPNNPSEAVLNREFSSIGWFVLIPLFFVGIGLGGVISAIRGQSDWELKSPASVARANAAWETEEPWMARPDWAAGRVVTSNKTAMLTVWVFAVLWNSISITITVMVLRDFSPQRTGYLPLVALLFPGVGLVLLGWAVRLLRRWLRYGDSVFEMASVPGVIGGTLEGVIRLREPIRPEGPVRLKLSCINRFTISDSDGSSTKEAVRWLHEQAVELNYSDTIPVAFLIPADAAPTNVFDSSDGTLWRLEVEARVPGVNLVAQFEVPVFAVELTPAQRAGAAKLVTHEKKEAEVFVQPADSRIRVQPSSSGGMKFYFPACRNPGIALLLVIFFIIWSGAIGLMLTHGVPLLFSMVFGFFDLLILFIVVDQLLASTRVEMDCEGAAVIRTMLGIQRRRLIPSSDITAIKLSPGMSSGSTVYYDLKIVLRNGREIGAGNGIKNGAEAEWVASEMRKALELE